jgi:hypothetical protein
VEVGRHPALNVDERGSGDGNGGTSVTMTVALR